MFNTTSQGLTMDFLSVKEFASHVRLHTNTIYRAIKSGRLNAFRVNTGKRSVFRISISEVQRLSEKNMQELMDLIHKKHRKERSEKKKTKLHQ